MHELSVKYNLNVSLFERLIKNGVDCVTLSTQHRMRPEVAKLISPAIYPDLLNHPSVTEFPAVLGVTKNVFFVDHTHPEEVVRCHPFVVHRTLPTRGLGAEANFQPQIAPRFQVILWSVAGEQSVWLEIQSKRKIA